MNYINAGVISPDEVRNVIREDINSGYNALSEEMEGEPNEQDPFNDILGGNSTEQAPFNLDEWEESKHPRKENGQFGKGSGNGEQENIKTSNKEKERKIKSIKINPEKDNYFPELNKEEQNKLGVSNQQVRLKKSIYERNQKHNDVNKGKDEELIGKALYSPEEVIPGNKSGYFHLITRIKDNQNSLVLIDIDTNSNDGYIDIVHYYAVNDKNRKRTIKKAEKNS